VTVVRHATVEDPAGDSRINVFLGGLFDLRANATLIVARKWRFQSFRQPLGESVFLVCFSVRTRWSVDFHSVNRNLLRRAEPQLHTFPTNCNYGQLNIGANDNSFPTFSA